ncbi:MAG: hypothetical protein ACJAZO_003382 [Myxococcota bacterium]
MENIVGVRGATGRGGVRCIAVSIGVRVANPSGRNLVDSVVAIVGDAIARLGSAWVAKAAAIIAVACGSDRASYAVVVLPSSRVLGVVIDDPITVVIAVVAQLGSAWVDRTLAVVEVGLIANVVSAGALTGDHRVVWVAKAVAIAIHCPARRILVDESVTVVVNTVAALIEVRLGFTGDCDKHQPALCRDLSAIRRPGTGVADVVDGRNRC